GNVELAQGNAKEAEDYFTKAIRLEPANAPLQMALADIYNRQGRLDEAQGVLEELVKKNPQQTGLHFVLAEFLLKRGLPDRALEQYSETLKSDAKRHDARDRLYDMYLVRSMIDEAKKLTADLEKQLPDDPGVAYFRGRDLELAGKIQPALDQFLEAVKLLNNFAPAFRRAGLAELRLGKETQGIEHLNQAIAIDPGETSARYALAQRLFSRKELAQATEHLKQILMRHPRHLGANVLRADIALIEGDTERARKVYEYLLAEFPKEPAGYFKMALLEEKENNYAAAIDLYRKLLSFDRGVLIPAQRLLALIASHEKKDYAAITAEVEKLQGASENSKAEYDLILASLALSSARSKEDLLKARALFEKSVAEKPELIGAYFGLAQIDAATGDLEAAAQSYNKLLQQNPKHVPTMMMLALTLERQEKHKEAADTYREILKLAPNFGPALNNLAWLLVDELNGNLDEALNFAESAKEQLPKEASVADTLAWVHFKRGSFRAAEPIIEEALELEKMAGHSSKPNPEILYHLAEIKTAAGEKDEARQAIKQALELAPPNHPKRSKMEELKKRLG
ncbi:MAG TPA: tetratricopeptide repeat protein, partial [Oligoflexia bacterium]|nr:tetratricopeptide repeat protein [Oligoflexia bacterium]